MRLLLLSVEKFFIVNFLVTFAAVTLALLIRDFFKPRR